MQEEPEEKRLFLAAHIEAAWPNHYPEGRLTAEESRHITLAFLGSIDYPALQDALKDFPKPPFQIALAGIAETLAFLPPTHPRVVALNVRWLEEENALAAYHSEIGVWLHAHHYPVDPRPFFFHVTVGRAPFERQAWEQEFRPIPLFISGIHLYESLGNLHYQSLWTLPLIRPFTELDHTADIAFQIQGKTAQQIHLHAQLALAFEYPPIAQFFSANLQDSLDEIIIALNQMVSRADAAIGCPFKAVSFHGQITKTNDQLLSWEMIVDV